MLRILDHTYLENKVTKFGKKKRKCSSRCTYRVSAQDSPLRKFFQPAFQLNRRDLPPKSSFEGKLEYQGKLSRESALPVPPLWQFPC